MSSIENRIVPSKRLTDISRRQFLALTGASSAQALLMSLARPARATGTEIVVRESWGHIEKLGDGIFMERNCFGVMTVMSGTSVLDLPMKKSSLTCFGVRFGHTGNSL